MGQLGKGVACGVLVLFDGDMWILGAFILRWRLVLVFNDDCILRDEDFFELDI